MSSSLFSPDPIREDFLLTWLIGHQLRSHYPKDHVFSATLLPPQGPAHGIVIGIDYDLGYQRDEDILADWQGYLPDKELRLLAHAGGLRGPTGAHYYATLPEIMISWETAFRFFREKTLPRWIIQASKVWPRYSALTADQRCALVSILMHLGKNLEGEDRREMALMADYLAAGKTAPIPHLIRSLAHGYRFRYPQVRLLAEADLFASKPATSSTSS